MYAQESFVMIARMMARSRFRSQLALLSALLLICQSGWAAVGFAETPAAVGNTYPGVIALVVSGLPTGASVIVQKYLDANNNGVIDAGDTLLQQFNLTDGQAGMVIGGVTNFNVPGDTDTVAGQITAKLFLQMDFSQLIIGNYLFRLSSPSNAFTPITNAFAVTNVSYPQKLTGTVLSNGVPVPYAAVLLLQPQGGSDSVNPVGGTVANSSGVYSISAPPGTYGLVSFQSSFVASAAAVSGLVLGGGATITTNLTLIPATQTISGRVVDANTGAGLPGFLLAAQNKSLGLLAITHTDTNGGFSVGVTASQWQIGGDSAAEAFAGYVGLANKPALSTTNGSVSNVTISLPKATALVYGTLKDVSGNPIPGVAQFYAEDQNFTNYNNTYQSDGYTFTNGSFVIAVVGGLGLNDQWQVNVENAGAFPDYNFSQPLSDSNGSTNIGVGQAIEVNISAEPAENYISGNVQYDGANLAGLTINANTQDTNGFQAQTITDNNGDYSLLVGNGVWSVNVNCHGNNNSLQSILGNNNFVCPCGPNVTISNNNATGVNIQVTSGGSGQIFGYLTDASSGAGISGISVNLQDQCSGQGYSTTTGGNGYYSITVPYGTYNVNVDCGGLNSLNYQCVNDANVTLSSGSAELDFAAQSNGGGSGNLFGWVDDAFGNAVGGLAVTATNAGGGASYSTTTDQNGYYAFVVTNGYWEVSLSCPGLNSRGYACISDGITNINADSAEVDFTVQPGSSSSALEILTASLPDVLVGMPYFQPVIASGGQAPYVWSLDSGSLPLPPGINLFPGGVVYGSVTAADLGTNYFLLDVTDNLGNATSQFLSMAVFPPLLLSSNALPSGTVGTPYNAQFAGSGGTGYYNGYQLLGNFPPGLNISYGLTTSSNQVFLISGTPTNSGSFTFTFILYDEQFEAQADFTITVGAANLQITTASTLPSATAGVYYFEPASSIRRHAALCLDHRQRITAAASFHHAFDQRPSFRRALGSRDKQFRRALDRS